MDFLYTQSYKTENDSKEVASFSHPKNIFVAHVSLYALGDKYQIPALCTFSANQFHWLISSEPRVFQLLMCVPLIYSSTPETDRRLRDLVVAELTHRSNDIAAEPGSNKVMLEHVNDIPQFRQDVVQGLLKRPVTKAPALVPKPINW